MDLKNQIFQIKSHKEFNAIALEIFNFQYKNNSTYHQFCKLLKIDPLTIREISQIPFLPIEFYKSHIIKTGEFKEEITFLSSGTSNLVQSKHYVKDLSVYETSFQKCFEQFYGNITNYCILALLPAYLEREGSSLIYMTEQLIKKSNHPLSGFYLDEYDDLIKKIDQLERQNQKTILLGVSFALLDLAEKFQLNLKNTIVMETGGMKGKRKELTRKELHNIFKEKFGTTCIHSEYGMTEILSQSYSKENGIYKCPKWMKVLIRDINDPSLILNSGKTGGVNIIDLANINSCSFIATQDLGMITDMEHFEILGRFDSSDLRGCNLLIN